MGHTLSSKNAASRSLPGILDDQASGSIQTIRSKRFGPLVRIIQQSTEKIKGNS
jgi:hypothetical protein